MSGEGINLNAATAARMHSGRLPADDSVDETKAATNAEEVTQEELLNGLTKFR